MWLLIILLELSSAQTMGMELTRENYVLSISEETLKTVTPITPGSTLDSALDLSNLKLKKIEKNVFDHLENLTNLTLANNELEELPPKIFFKLQNLQTLSLAHNKINYFDKYFIGLNNLKLLNLSNNAINSLQKADLLGVSKSTHIIVQGNMLQMLSVDSFDDPSQPRYLPPKPNDEYADPWSNMEVYNEELEAFENAKSKNTAYWSSLELQTLNLANHNITEIIPEIFGDLPEFITIGNLENNKIEIIKKNDIQNKFLRKLNLDHNVITTIEDGAFERTSLLSISIKHNRLKNLNFVGSLPMSVQELMLEGNEISEIPEELLGRLKTLKHFVIPHNQISYLSAGAFLGLKKLRIIDFSDNLLERIEPGTFKDQKKLSILKLRGNKINELEAGVFDGLRKLHKLDLEANAIKKISRDSFAGLKNSVMYKLKLSENQIDTVEEGSFANMTIELLLLNGNGISETSIAKGAFEGCTLSWLSLASNSFTHINGDSFYGILVYREIALSYNNIRSIEKGAAKYMGGVKVLDLRSNPVERIENGSLFGFRRGPLAKILISNGVKVIEGGAFDDI